MSRIAAKYLAYRLAVSYVTVLLIMTLLFVLLRSTPGGLVDAMVTPGMSADQVEALREQWGLNEPFWRQYLAFMINYQVGNFGVSPTWNQPVWALIERRLPRTLILFGAAFLVGYIVGPLVGMYLGWWRGTKRDTYAFTGGLLAYSMPAFWIAWLLIWLFNYELGLFPSRQMLPLFAEDWNALTLIGRTLHHLALPAFSIASVGWVGAMLVMRTQMNAVVDADYILLARAKGLSERAVMIKHAGRTALIPVATQAIVGIAFIIDGAVVIERVFSWPGMGDLLIRAVLNNDYPTAQAVFVMLAVTIVAMRFLTDVVYTYLDPRISFGEEP